MGAPIDKARGEGNCARVTGGGKEAGAKTARLRTETRYKAGEVRRVSTTSRSRSQTTAQVNRELVQRKIMSLSGETCTAWLRPRVAPASRACPNAGNGAAKAAPGGAGVSRGRSTTTRSPIETGRTKR